MGGWGANVQLGEGQVRGNGMCKTREPVSHYCLLLARRVSELCDAAQQGLTKLLLDVCLALSTVYRFFEHCKSTSCHSQQCRTLNNHRHYRCGDMLILFFMPVLLLQEAC